MDPNRGQKGTSPIRSVLPPSAALLQLTELETLGLIYTELFKANSLLTRLVSKAEAFVLENPKSVLSLQKTVTTAGTAEQLPPVTIPYDCAVLILALSTNSGTIYVGKSKLDAEDHTKSYPIEVNDSIEYKIKNLSVLWIDAEVSGEGIVWTVEQNG